MTLTYSRTRRVNPNRNGSTEQHQDKEMKKDSLYLCMTDLILFSVLSHILFCLGSKLRATFSNRESSQSPRVTFLLCK